MIEVVVTRRFTDKDEIEKNGVVFLRIKDEPVQDSSGAATLNSLKFKRISVFDDNGKAVNKFDMGRLLATFPGLTFEGGKTVVNLMLQSKDSISFLDFFGLVR